MAIDTVHDPNLGKLRGKNVAFKFSVDGVTICHLGDVGEYLTESLTEEIGKVDVMLIPVGGNYTLDGKEAANYVLNTHPKIVIPMHYKTPNLDIDVDSVDKFLLTLGIPYETCGEEIEIDKNNLPTATEIIVMKADRA